MNLDVAEFKRVEDELRNKTKQLQTITDAMSAYLRTGSWREANQRLLRGALEDSQSAYGFAGVIVEGPVLRILAHEGVVWSPQVNRDFYEEALRTYEHTGYLEFKNFDNLFGKAITTGKAVLSNDCPHDSRSGGIPSGHPRLDSFLGVPVLMEDRVIGILGVANRPGGYTSVQQEQLEPLAKAAGVLFDGYLRLQREEDLKDQLRQAQKMDAIGRLAGGIAHDFNNVLTVIKGYSQIMSEIASSEEMTGPIEEIQKAADRAVRLTRQLLAFSRRRMQQLKVFDVNRLVEDIAPMVQRLIGEDVELISNCEANPAIIKADQSQIEQVLMNLAVNARDAMPGGGRLTIRTATVKLTERDATRYGPAPGVYVVMSVTDTGCGMDPSIVPRIFEPFFTTKESGKGTGLGLSTVYGIVQQSGGAIHVQTKPGRGATFNIHLPLSLDESLTEASIRLVTPSSAAATILLVEDDPMVRGLTTTALRREGYEVLEASNDAEALSHCREFNGPIHMVLSDIVMPGASGPETVIRLKSMRPGMKTLFMSGYIGDTLSWHGIRESEIAFLDKPFTPAALTQKVAEVLGSPSTVIVADDDESVLRFVTKTLEMAGFRTLPASNGVEVIKLLGETPCELLVTDLIMPHKDGVDLAIEVQRAFPNLPIIAISGAGSLKAISFAAKLRNVAPLEKPFTSEQLLTLAGQLVGL